MRFGAGQENITVLGVCNAAGVVLDPLTVFNGQNMQSSWYEVKALPNTWYGRSENNRLWLLVASNILGISYIFLVENSITKRFIQKNGIFLEY